MTRLRLFVHLAGVALALSSLPGSAWAHPGHDSISGGGAGALVGVEAPDLRETPRANQGTTGSLNARRQRASAATTLVAAALGLLAAIPHRRRALALALIGLLATVSLEGALHAALHLHQVRHADSLAIGASPAQQAAADLDTDGPATVPDILLVEVAERYDPPMTVVVLASNRGRAPPISPA